MNCSIIQPSYIPWRGFFHSIQKADVFVHYDDVQYDKHGWRNRNKTKTPKGSTWLTIPVRSKGNVVDSVPINAVSMCNEQGWAKKHWETLRQFYRKTPCFHRYAKTLEAFYADPPEMLADFTVPLTEYLARELGITQTKFIRSSDLAAQGRKTDRLVPVLQQVGATHYISGPSARGYMEEEKLTAAGISLEYMTYDYPQYAQLHPPFDQYVTVLDLLFQYGPDAADYIWRTPEERRAAA